MIDTHAHVHVDAFDSDRPRVLTRAFASGLRAVVEVNIHPEGWPAVARLAESDPRIFATVGIHPNEVHEGSLGEMGRLEHAVEHPRVRAVGETGLDYYRDRSTPELQQELFRRHIALARERDLPLVVHCRNAHEDVVRLLREEGRGGVRGVMHCFSGDLETARKSLEMGFLLGLGGNITYDEERWRPLLCDVGLDGLVVETDCPYLTPAPHRGQRNEPAHVWHTALTLARYLGVNIDEVERVTDRNAMKLFGMIGES
jgi:TatD DNase family protein